MNIQEIKDSYNIVDVIGKQIHLKRSGINYIGNCPQHSDTHESLVVSNQKKSFKCFVCGFKGDVVGYFTKQGKSVAEAKQIITGGLDTKPAYIEPVSQSQDIQLIDVVPPQDFLPNISSIDFTIRGVLMGKPSMYWVYHNAKSEVIGYILRFETAEGKQIAPYVYKSNGKSSNWYTSGFNTPRPLYNLHLISQFPDHDIILVEGEKAADAASKLFPEFVCTTWIGGADGIGAADFSVLKGRNVFCWADNDLAGVLCMFGGWRQNKSTKEYKRVKGITDRVTANFKRINNQKDFPNKWDVADADWSVEYAAEYLKNNISDLPVISEFPPNELPLPSAAIELPVFIPPTPPVAATKNHKIMGNSYFRILGYESINNGTSFAFLVYRTNLIVKLSASSMTIANLLQIAPLDHWEGNYPRKGSKFDVTAVSDDLIVKAMKVGMFNPRNVRGRGMWNDEGRSVFHCGNSLIVDGKTTSIADFNSRYVYEAGQDLDFEFSEPLKLTEANKLLGILERFNWSRDINYRMLAGWIVVAPLCGALPWRSHLWITGSAGTGKSWIMNHVVKKMTSEIGLNAQSDSTAAGIRGYLKSDALPVTIDEIESETKQAKERTQMVLELARASSTQEGGSIIKGTQGGGSVLYETRSIFAFSSVGVELTHRSDKSRITVLELKPDRTESRTDKWAETQRLYYNLITDEYVRKFISRSIIMLPVILENAKIFSIAAAKALDGQRAGDQIGILLAGAYSLSSDKVITYEKALKFITEKDWSEDKLTEDSLDEMELLSKIIRSDIQVETMGGQRTRTIGEVIHAALGYQPRTDHENNLFGKDTAYDTLLRAGIKIIDDDVYFSDNSDYLRRILEKTSWSVNYPMVLGRIEGASKTEKMQFSPGVKTKSVKINSSLLFDKPEPALKIVKSEILQQSEINFRNNLHG